MTAPDEAHNGKVTVIGSVRIPTEIVKAVDAAIAQLNKADPHRPLTRNAAIRIALTKWAADVTRKR